MEINLIELLENPQKLNYVTVIRTDYKTFEENEFFIEKNLGKFAKGFFIEKSAYVIFENKPKNIDLTNINYGYNIKNFETLINYDVIEMLGNELSDRKIAEQLGRKQRTFADQMKKYRTEFRKMRGY